MPIFLQFFFKDSCNSDKTAKNFLQKIYLIFVKKIYKNSCHIKMYSRHGDISGKKSY